MKFLLVLTFTVNYVHGGVFLNESNSDMMCAPEERYKCLPSCQESCNYKPKTCPAQCQFSCFCKDGYVRLSNVTGSPCVIRHSCFRRNIMTKSMFNCTENEEYYKCGLSCPASCAHLMYPYKQTPCSLQCVSGCFCKHGLYRTEIGKCIKPEECCIGENEYFDKCGSACPEFCHSGIQTCSKQCVIGCYCKSGFIRKDNNSNSPCIQSNEC